jgi:hypothetical protein
MRRSLRRRRPCDSSDPFVDRGVGVDWRRRFVTGRVDSDDSSVIAKRPASQERSERSTLEHERLGIESRRQRLPQEAAHDPWHRRVQVLKFLLIDEDSRA